MSAPSQPRLPTTTTPTPPPVRRPLHSCRRHNKQRCARGPRGETYSSNQEFSYDTDVLGAGSRHNWKTRANVSPGTLLAMGPLWFVLRTIIRNLKIIMSVVGLFKKQSTLILGSIHWDTAIVK